MSRRLHVEWGRSEAQISQVKPDKESTGSAWIQTEMEEVSQHLDTELGLSGFMGVVLLYLHSFMSDSMRCVHMICIWISLTGNYTFLLTTITSKLQIHRDTLPRCHTHTNHDSTSQVHSWHESPRVAVEMPAVVSREFFPRNSIFILLSVKMRGIWICFCLPNVSIMMICFAFCIRIYSASGTAPGVSSTTVKQPVWSRSDMIITFFVISLLRNSLSLMSPSLCGIPRSHSSPKSGF